MIENIIVIIIILAIAISIIFYLIKAKKRGDRCIGCPYAKKCIKKSCQNSTIDNANTK